MRRFLILFFLGLLRNHYFYAKKQLVSSNREYFEDEFCEWYEPGAKKKGYSRETAPNRTKLFFIEKPRQTKLHIHVKVQTNQYETKPSSYLQPNITLSRPNPENPNQPGLNNST
jgi:hypothetical protein